MIVSLPPPILAYRTFAIPQRVSKFTANSTLCLEPWNFRNRSKHIITQVHNFIIKLHGSNLDLLPPNRTKFFYVISFSSSSHILEQKLTTNSWILTYSNSSFTKNWLQVTIAIEKASLNRLSNKRVVHLHQLLLSFFFMLWPTVSRPIHLGVRHTFGAHDKSFIFPLYSRTVAFLFVLWRPLWREEGSVICSAICRWSESQRTHNDTLPSHLRLLSSLSVVSYDSQGLRSKYPSQPQHRVVLSLL
jgi:hypothetical protein